MARKRLLTSSGGGIAPGSPFVVGKGLLVEQVSPPFAMSGRYGQLADAMLSFVAPDVSGAAHTFVVGAGSQGGLSQKTNLIGENLHTNGLAGSDRNIYLGGNIDFSAAAGGDADKICIGWDMAVVSPTNSGNAIYIGHSIRISAASAGALIMGHGAIVSGGDSTGVGTGVQVTGEGTAVGKAAIVAGAQGCAFGKGARANGLRAIAIGMNTKADADNEISIGFGMNTIGFANPVRIGRNAVVFGNNEWALGNDPTDGTEMQTLRLGPNILSGYPGLNIFLPSSEAGVNNHAAPPTVIRGGLSLGNAAKGGKLTLQSSLIGAGGTTYQTVMDVLRVQSGGTIGNPALAFLNMIINAGAVVASKTVEIEVNGVVEQFLLA